MIAEADAEAAIPEGSWIARYVESARRCTDCPLPFIVASAYALATLTVPQDMAILFGGELHAQSYTMIIGSTASRKTVAVKQATKVVSAWDPAMLISDPESEAGLAESMRDNPQALLALPEMGNFLRSTMAGSYKHNIRSRLTALWDGDPFTRRTKDEDLRIEAPRLGVLGAVAPSFLEESLTPHDFDGGFLNRFLLILAERERDYPIPPVAKMDKAIGAEWGALRAGARANWQGCTGWAPDGEAYWTAWMKVCTNHYRGNIRMDGFVGRVGPLVLKAAMALAVLEGRTKKGWRLDRALLEAPCWLGLLHLQSASTLMENLALGSFAALRRSVLRMLIANPAGLSLAQVLSGLVSMGVPQRKREVVEVLDTLVAEGRLDQAIDVGARAVFVVRADRAAK